MAGTPSIGPHAPVGRGSTMTMKARSDTSAVTRPREINGIRSDQLAALLMDTTPINIGVTECLTRRPKSPGSPDPAWAIRTLYGPECATSDRADTVRLPTIWIICWVCRHVSGPSNNLVGSPPYDTNADRCIW